MAKRNGWITTRGIIFTVAIILLAAGIWGGLKIASQRGEQARRDAAVEKAQEKIDEIAKNESTEKDAEKDEERSGTQTNNNDVAVSTDDDTEGESLPQGGVAVDELPQTGPADAFAAIALGALAFSASAFAESKRRLQRS